MKHSRTLVSFAVTSALVAFAGGAQASGFALIEQSASGMGNAFAGAAATASDASTIYFNPAGMSRLPGRQVVIAGHAIRPSSEFTNTTSTLAPLQTSLGDNGGDAGDWAFVPNAYLSWQIDPKWHVGVGINSPFGLKTEYTPTWAGRFYAIESNLKTINVNPSVAYQVNDKVSVGAGLNWQRAQATLTNSVNYSAAAFAAGGLGAVAAVGGAGREGIAAVQGDDTAYGYNLGALFNFGPATRIGIAYRSAISYNIAGTVTFANRPALLAAGLPDGAVTASLKVPASASWSVVHQLNPKWELLGDITWTGWSSVKVLNVVRAGAATPLTTTPLNWSDTWRFSGGANYHLNDAWTLRMGVAYDQSPVPDADRTPRIPDQDRTWLAAGGQYRMSKQSALDFGFAYLFVKDPTLNLCNAAQAAANPAACSGKNNLAGTYNNNVKILSAQFRYSF